MSEDNTYIAEPNLEILPLRYFVKGLFQFLFLKTFFRKNNVLSDDKKQCRKQKSNACN